MNGPFGDFVGYLTDGASWEGQYGLGNRFVEHLGLSLLALLVATVVALPLGLWLGHIGRGGFVAINAGNVGRAVPVFALVVIFILVGPPLGSSIQSFVIALALFSLPPLLTNAYTGVREVDRAAVDAGRGVGMSGWQLLVQVELPLATPLLLSGLRLAAVQVVATASVLGLVGGPGLGRVISTGFRQADQPMVLSGALLVAVLALATELGLAALERRVSRRPSGEQDDAEDADGPVGDEEGGPRAPTREKAETRT